MKKTRKALLFTIAFLILCLCLGIAGGMVAFGESVYEIGTADELLKIGTDANYPLSGSYKLTADIDLSGKQWTPIGNGSIFSGVFDGNGHTISGMTTGSRETSSETGVAWGMFSELSGTVKNLKLENVCFNVGKIGNNKPVGGICGYITSGAMVENVYISGSITDITSRQCRVGGIAGSTHGSEYTIKDCYVAADIVAGYVQTSGNLNVGVAGLVGGVKHSGSFSDCLFAGSVTCTTGGYAGTLMSEYEGNATAIQGSTVTNCYSIGTVSCANGSLIGVDMGTKITTEQLLNGYLSGKLSDAWTVEDGYVPYLALFGGGSEMALEDACKAVKNALDAFSVDNNTTQNDILSEAMRSVSGAKVSLSVESFDLKPSTNLEEGSLSVSVKVSAGSNAETVSHTYTISRIPVLVYDLTSTVPGRADGLISILLPSVYGNEAYALYWGTEDGVSGNYSSLTTMEDISVSENKMILTYVPEPQTYIPQGITHLWLTLNGAKVSFVEIPEAHRMVSGTLKYSFGVFSDVHFQASASTANNSFIAAMNLYKAAGATFVVSCGDMTTGGRATEYAQFNAAYAAGGYTMPFWTTVGNHDILKWNLASDLTPAQAMQNLTSAIKTFANVNHGAGSAYTVTVPSKGQNVDYDYTMAYGGDLFVFMGVGVASNSSVNPATGDLVNVDQKLADSQLNWLEYTLNKYYNVDQKDGQVFLIFHYYTLESGKYYSTATGTEWDAASSFKLDQLLRKYPGVIHFNGHDHFYFDVDMNMYADEYVSIHVPSLTNPRPSRDGTEGSGSAYENYIVSVYDEFILVNGVDALTGTYTPHAMFMIAEDSFSVPASDNSGADGREIELRATETHIQWRYVGDTEWKDLIALESLKGADGQNGTNGTNGTNGKEVEFNVSSTHVQWRYIGDTEWKDLIALESLKGVDGQNGQNGVNGTNGKEVEFNVSSTHVQWRYIGDTEWKNLVALESLKGADGQDGTNGKDGREVEFKVEGEKLWWRYKGDAAWTALYSIDDLKGSAGVAGPAGPAGKDGADGKNGVDGKDGADGKDGVDGADGLGISAVSVDENGDLIITMSDGSTVNAGAVTEEASSDLGAAFWLALAALLVSCAGVVIGLIRKK